MQNNNYGLMINDLMISYTVQDKVLGSVTQSFPTFCSDKGLTLETSANTLFRVSAYPHQLYVDTLYVDP